MVQPAFELGSATPPDFPAESRLLIEISNQSLNYIIYTCGPEELLLLRQYRMYTTADRSTRDLIDEIIAGDEILHQFAQRATIIYNFPGEDLLPAGVYQASLKEPVARLVGGSAAGDIVFDEKIESLDIHNIYRIPKDIHVLCRDRFPDAAFRHIYTPLLRWSQRDNNDSGKICRVLFYNDKFIVAFFDGRQLQLVQTFYYQTPEDVAYYLLLICRQFNIPQQELILFISGLIDTQSALYSELLKYFTEVAFEGLPDNYDSKGLLGEFPAHYFSPLIKLSLCV